MLGMLFLTQVPCAQAPVTLVTQSVTSEVSKPTVYDPAVGEEVTVGDAVGECVDVGAADTVGKEVGETETVGAGDVSNRRLFVWCAWTWAGGPSMASPVGPDPPSTAGLLASSRWLDAGSAATPRTITPATSIPQSTTSRSTRRSRWRARASSIAMRSASVAIASRRVSRRLGLLVAASTSGTGSMESQKTATSWP